MEDMDYSKYEDFLKTENYLAGDYAAFSSDLYDCEESLKNPADYLEDYYAFCDELDAYDDDENNPYLNY